MKDGRRQLYKTSQFVWLSIVSLLQAFCLLFYKLFDLLVKLLVVLVNT